MTRLDALRLIRSAPRQTSSDAKIGRRIVYATADRAKVTMDKPRTLTAWLARYGRTA